MSGNAPVVYFFRTKDNYNNVTTELPVTSPNWLPDPAAFFTGVEDMDNASDIVPDSLDILDSFFARDDKYLYSAVRMQGAISPGSMDPPYIHFYVGKFSNPAVDQGEGLMVGSMLVFSPLFYVPYALVDVKNENGLGRLNDSCRMLNPYTGRRTAVDNNLLFTRAPIDELCPGKCDMLRAIFISAANASIDSLMPIPVNCSPFLLIYLRAHAIGIQDDKDIPVVVGALEGKTLAKPATDSLSLVDNNIDAKTLLIADQATQDAMEQRYETWMLDTFHINAGPNALPHNRMTRFFEGTGPFRIQPCDVINFKNFTFEAYTRDSIHIKLRLIKDGKLEHTLMIGPTTKPMRDEIHDFKEFRVQVSDMSYSSLSCTFEISKLSP